MKYLALFLLSALFFTACDQKNVDPAQKPLEGTYEVTHLKQYQGNTLLFEGDLPTILGDTMTIKHKLSIQLSTTKSSSTDAFVGYLMQQSWGNYTRAYGRPIANNQVRIAATQSPGTFSFTSNSKLIGVSDGKSLSFDFVVADSLDRQMRYVYEAVKISDTPSRY